MKPVRIRPRADAEIDALADYIAADSPTATLRFFIVPTLPRGNARLGALRREAYCRNGKTRGSHAGAWEPSPTP